MSGPTPIEWAIPGKLDNESNHIMIREIPKLNQMKGIHS
jgi:hypothetical protein